MSRHVLTTVAVAVLSLSVFGPPVQAQDNQSAQELAELSALAEAGATEAQYSIGAKYDTGEGVPQDNIEAHMWLNLAASRFTGEQRERTVAARDVVAARMTSADLSEAQRRAREWHAAHPVP